MIQDIEYKRDLTHNYLIMPFNDLKDYQMRMIMENSIPGVLPLRVREWNGEEKLYYDISSKQPLSRMFEREEIRIDDLKGIIYSLDDIKSELKRFLLDESLLVVDPDNCYIEPGQNRVEWILYPDIDTDIDREYLKLAEFILEHVDHNDVMARETAYEMYKMIKESRFSIDRIVEFCEKQNAAEDKLVEVQAQREYQAIREQKEAEEPSLPGANQELNEGWFKKLCGLFKKNKGDEWLREKETTDFDVYVREDEKYQPYIGQLEDDYGKTVVINQGTRPPKGLLIGTGEIDHNTYDVSGDSLIIGSFKERVDIFINLKKVSRMHAKIYKESNRYFLQDLNSVNGTQKNGLLLESNEIVELKSGDEIIIAKTVTYVFE